MREPARVLLIEDDEGDAFLVRELLIEVAPEIDIVTAATLAEAEAIFAQAVALKVDPNAPAEDDPYADPRFQVPDDLVW
jgi:uncharacterized protein YaiL (DUF2058 family)